MHLNMNGEDFRHPDMHLLELLAVVQLQTIVLDDLAAFAHGVDVGHIDTDRWP